MLTSSNADPAFTENGFSNWKNAIEKQKGFQKHESSDSHMEAVARYVTAPATVTGDIGDLLSERHALEKSKNRKILMAGEKTGVARQIKTINGECLYTQCYGHALNLAVADAIESVQCISDSLDTVREIGKLDKKSPQRNTKLDKKKSRNQE